MMGCGISSHYPPDIDLKDIDDDTDSTTGNKPTTVRFRDVKERGAKDTGKQTTNDVMRGDVTQKHQAKLARKMNLEEKQKKVAYAAEELANQVLEEKERLSLTSRSRATSRATSRTASPTGTRKHIAYKPQISQVKSEHEDQTNELSPHESTSNGHARVNS